jgi:hypothetical protein
LAQQISATHRKKLTDTSVDSSERPVTAGVAGTIADAMLAKITLNPDRLLDLLGKGWVSADPPPPSGLAAPFTANSLGSVWQTWLNSDYSGRNFYVAVPVDGPSDQRFRVRLRLVQWVWKLSGLDLPESTITHLTQELTRRN